MEIRPKYLVMVTAGNNNNKYYRMIPNGDGFWTAEYGRIGSSPQKRTYSVSLWNKKYNEKISKGYVDQSDLIEDLISVEEPKTDSQWKEIENKAIADIVRRLQSMANQAISENYNVSSNKVTEAMVEQAQIVINELVDINEVNEFNKKLIELFGVIPRKMESVQLYMSKDKEEFADIIKREQDLLDVMKGQVVQKVVEKKVERTAEGDNKKTILEAMDLEFYECDSEDIGIIKNLLGSCSDKFYNAWKVVNKKTQKKFDEFCKLENIKDHRFLWHGSRNENWWSIINTGLVLKPTNAVITGKMFGYGIYYAPKASKSLGYTSLSGSYWARGSSSSAFMAIMDVAYGVPYNVYSFDSKYNSLNYEGLKKLDKKANCLHAHAGSMLRNDEIIVYKEEQCTIKYLVELR